MIDQQLELLSKHAFSDIKDAPDLAAIECVRVKYLGKKGLLTDILKGLATIDANDRPRLGHLANQFKTEFLDLLNAKQTEFARNSAELKIASSRVDIDLPAVKRPQGRLHPVQQVMKDVIEIFSRLGFSVKEGPDVENEYYNFEALNIPSDHPARDMHDTFYLKMGQLLRTHTSPVQIRTMEAQVPPIKIIVPGNVYRYETDITHSPMFHQIEGLYVDQSVSFAQLKWTLTYFLTEFFGKEWKIRFRPSYFPFTEPSTEVDVECGRCAGAGCQSCKYTGWLEILGAGMVNRKVFKAVGYDPDQLTGFAFGIGIERLVMLKYKIADIRLLYENDMRFLRQI